MNKTSNYFKRISCLLVCFIAVVLALPNFVDIKTKFLPSKKLNLGLDLRGGSQLLLKIDFNTYMLEQNQVLMANIRSALIAQHLGYSKLNIVVDKITFTLRENTNISQIREALKDMLNSVEIEQNQNIVTIKYNDDFIHQLKQNVLAQSIEIVRRRIDETGVREPSIQRQGENYILLQVPGLENPAQLKEMLGKTAKLSFNLVNDNISDISGGIEYLPYEKSPEKLPIKKHPSISGDLIIDAKAIYGQNNQPVVSLSFNSIGAKKFSIMTKNNIGKYIAIILDNKIISVANIREGISGGSSVISGNFTIESANELALLLRAGALPAPLTIEEERVVGPNLGEDSIKASKIAFIVSAIMVMFFMIVTYGMLGIFASVALSINLLLIIACLSLFDATLTLPGIAGMILTMGMAVDANVLIFERIREELKIHINNNNIRAINLGFEHAFTTIFDSNITTLIVALMLYIYGSGAIKGFAVTLTIGIICSMFSAITISRLMILSWAQNKAKKISL